MTTHLSTRLVWHDDRWNGKRGRQNAVYSGRLYLVVAVMVLVSTLVSTWCPPKPEIESTAAKW